MTIFRCRLSSNLGASTSWNPQGLSRPVMGLLYLLFQVCFVVYLLVLLFIICCNRYKVFVQQLKICSRLSAWVGVISTKVLDLVFFLYANCSFAAVCLLALQLLHKVYRLSSSSVFLGLLLLLLNTASHRAPFIPLTFPRINIYSVNKIYLGISCSCICGNFQTISITRHIHNSSEKFLWAVCFCLLTGRTSLPSYWTAHSPVYVSWCEQTVIVELHYRPTLPVSWTYL